MKEIVEACFALLDLIYDTQHQHLHLVEGNDGDYAPKAAEAAKRLADLIGYLPMPERERPGVSRAAAGGEVGGTTT